MIFQRLLKRQNELVKGCGTIILPKGGVVGRDMQSRSEEVAKFRQKSIHKYHLPKVEEWIS